MKCVLIWDGQEGKSLPERSILEAAGPGRVARVGWGSRGLSPDLEEGFSVPRGRRGPPGGTGRALGVCTPFQGVRASDRAVGLWGATACPAMPGEAAPSALQPSPSWNAGALVRPLSHSSSPQSGLGSRKYTLGAGKLTASTCTPQPRIGPGTSAPAKTRRIWTLGPGPSQAVNCLLKVHLHSSEVCFSFSGSFVLTNQMFCL